ncbi:S9 family peptidase [Spirulina subsalsa FACHB-351]|uniref:S9 family peptidase n=1 Tax=Spirulina subsalsa FACHB-351 TaxID=234711 RepID=A0ABT3L880_9CYAN|nr:S9 family peptidase [Spirulina subsalsa]MCW6037377.1 S9 family peptidase [Spirulina subsalsa FACHB-351]
MKQYLKNNFATLLILGGLLQNNGVLAHEIFTRSLETHSFSHFPLTVNDSEQAAVLIDHEHFFGEPALSDLTLSPDGQYLAFRKPWQGVSNLWVKPLDAPFTEAYRVTESDRPIASYFWSKDGQTILYLQDQAGNENFQIYAISPHTLTPSRQLTPPTDVRALILATPQATPHQIIIGLNQRDPRYHDVYQLDITTGKKHRLRENDQTIVDWITDHTGNLRLAVRRTPNGDTEILRVDPHHFTPLYRCNFQETCSVLRFHPNGEQVYVISNRGEHLDKTRLILLDLNRKSYQLIHQDPQKSVDFGFALFAAEDERLLATYYEGDRWRVYPQDPQFAQDITLLQTLLPPGDIFFQSATTDDRLQIITLRSDINPGSVYLFNRQTRTIQHLYNLRPHLSPQDLAPMHSFRYTARDNLEIPAYLTLPGNKPPHNLPLVVFPHGGPWARDSWGYNPYVQFLANRGYAVFQPNFRGSTGYGKAFLNAGNQQWGTGAMQHDITDGVEYLIEQGIADPERIAIFGISYGGFAALAGLAFTPHLYQAGISYVGISNIVTFLENIPPYWKPFQKFLTLRVGDPNDPQDKQRLQQQSPLFAVEHIQSPLLVIQGANDPRVRATESHQIVIALRDLGQEVEYLLAPDEGHGFTQSINRLAVAVAIERFLAHHLGGPYQETLPPALQTRLQELTIDVDQITIPIEPKEWGYGLVPLNK